jgi:hypothetical protein
MLMVTALGMAIAGMGRSSKVGRATNGRDVGSRGFGISCTRAGHSFIMPV